MLVVKAKKNSNNTWTLLDPRSGKAMATTRTTGAEAAGICEYLLNMDDGTVTIEREEWTHAELVEAYSGGASPSPLRAWCSSCADRKSS